MYIHTYIYCSKDLSKISWESFSSALVCALRSISDPIRLWAGNSSLSTTTSLVFWPLSKLERDVTSIEFWQEVSQ